MWLASPRWSHLGSLATCIGAASIGRACHELPIRNMKQLSNIGVLHKFWGISLGPSISSTPYCKPRQNWGPRYLIARCMLCAPHLSLLKEMDWLTHGLGCKKLVALQIHWIPLDSNCNYTKCSLQTKHGVLDSNNSFTPHRHRHRTYDHPDKWRGSIIQQTLRTSDNLLFIIVVVNEWSLKILNLCSTR